MNIILIIEFVFRFLKSYIFNYYLFVRVLLKILKINNKSKCIFRFKNSIYNIFFLSKFFDKYKIFYLI